MTEKEEGHDYGTVVWMHARIAVEGLHAAIWVFLVLAAFLFPTSSLIFPILLLMCVPIGWKAAGACPLSILEDYLSSACGVSILGGGVVQRAGVPNA